MASVSNLKLTTAFQELAQIFLFVMSKGPGFKTFYSPHQAKANLIPVVKLIGFIANLHPPKVRAQFGRGCLDSLGLEDIPICWGEEAEADLSKREDPQPWEFPDTVFKLLWAKDATFTPYGRDKKVEADQHEIQSGVKFLDRIVKEKIESREKDSPKLTFLLISGLADIATFAKREPKKLGLATEKIVLQGEYKLEQGVVKPNLKAANNAFDEQEAAEFHKYIESYHIPSVVYTRYAAMGAKMDAKLFQDLKATGHPIGVHLATVQKIQDTAFYERACNKDPAKRFLPHLDQEWFLGGKTNWYEKNPKPKDGSKPKSPPVGSDIAPFVQLVFYDVLAALGTAGNDVLRALEVLDPAGLLDNEDNIHQIVGREKKNPDPKGRPIQDPQIKVENMKMAIAALMKGSLLAVQQKIPSTHVA